VKENADRPGGVECEEDPKMRETKTPRADNPFQGGGDSGHVNPVDGDARSGKAGKGPVKGGETKQEHEEGEVGQFTGEGQPARQQR
jgi:hypothetical protein